MKKNCFLIIIILIVVLLAGFWIFRNDFLRIDSESEGINEIMKGTEILKEFERYGFLTNTAKKNIDLKLVVSGGPGKGGIPAITSPKFTTIEESGLQEEAVGIFVEIDGIRRFYPYSILTWHEIVNDKLGNAEIAVTFCPLCATGIVFDRRVGEEILTFKVSGLLYQSNLLMYDTKTESLWSQAKHEAVVGHFTGAKLNIMPMQVIAFKELKEKYSDSEILSENTGYSRNYRSNPYSGYEDTEDLYFPVSVSDKRYSAKEIMYVIPIEGKSVSIQQSKIQKGASSNKFSVLGKDLIIYRDGDEIRAEFNRELVPGYYEMWFSWATHHQMDGIVLVP